MAFGRKEQKTDTSGLDVDVFRSGASEVRDLKMDVEDEEGCCQ